MRSLQERLAQLEDHIQRERYGRRNSTDKDYGRPVLPTPSEPGEAAATDHIAVSNPSAAPRPQQSPESVRAGLQSRPSMAPLTESSVFQPSIMSPQGTVSDEFKDDSEAAGADGDTGSITAMGMHRQTPEDAASTPGEFYGGSSATAFFSQLHGRLHHPSTSKQVDQSRPPERPQQQRLKRAAGRGSGATFAEQAFRQMDDYYLPPRHVADQLLDLYWRRIHCIYPYLHWPTLIQAYRRLWMSDAELEASPPLTGVGLGGPDCPPPVFYCAINAIFALGMRFSLSAGTARQRVERSEPFAHRARHLLHLDCLDRGSVALVQALLIKAHYLQSTNMPSRCWNLTGVACRVAQGLGLHLEVDEGTVPALTREMRKRVWYGCANLDV